MWNNMIYEINWNYFQGYVPAFVRLGPQTILTFIFFEQLKGRFGYLPEKPAT